MHGPTDQSQYMLALSELAAEFHAYDPPTSLFHDAAWIGPALFRSAVENA